MLRSHDQNSTGRPRTFKVAASLPLLLLLFVWSSHQFAGAYVHHNQARENPTSASDIVVIANAAGTTVYLLDPVKKRIYRKRLTATVPERLNFDEFESVPALASLLDPAALAQSGTNLVIYDRSAQSVYQLDTATSEVKKLIDDAGVTKPVTMAASRGGAIALSGDDDGRVVLFEPAAAGQESPTTFNKRVMDASIKNTARLVFIRNNLLAVDPEGKIFHIDAKDEELKSSNVVVENIKNTVTNVQDLTYLNGVFYVASEGRILAFTPVSSHKSFLIFQEREPAGRSRLARITASRDHLFIAEQNSPALLVLPRPVPINVNFEPNLDSQSLEKNYERQREALIFLYEYLSNRNILPTREFVSKRRYETLKQLLFDQRVLIDGDHSSVISEGKVKSDTRLALLLCKYNREFCFAAQGSPLNRPVTDNQTLVLPNVPMRPELTPIYMPTGPKTVREVLDQILIPEHRAQITAEYLLKTNSSYREVGLEVELAKTNFIPSSQIGLQLKPGKFIQFQNGRERIVGDLATCNPDFINRIRSVKAEVPEPLSITKEVLPWKVSEPLNSSSVTAEKLDINQTVIDFNDWIVESTDLRTVDAMLQNGSRPACVSAEGDVFLVQQAIKTTGARIKFFEKSSSTSFLKWRTGEFKEAFGRPDENRQYSLIVDDALYLGYTLLKVDLKKPANEWTKVNWREVKPESTNEIFRSKGAFRLPATRWRVSFFANAVDVYNFDSELNRTLQMPGVTLLKEERFETFKTSSVNANNTVNTWVPDDPSDQRELIKKNRRILLERLKRFPPLSRLSEVRVGIAEAKSSIQVDHPDIVGMWYQKSGDIDLEPIIVANPAAVPASTDLIKKFVASKDHGNHVVGLLAARGDTAPGLAPGVQLFLIDTTNQESEASLERDINDAIVRDVRIFNMSFTIGGPNAPVSNPPLDKLKYIMRTNSAWRNALFIAAAGNEGQNLGDLSDRALVKWVVDVPNILGVGAADDGNNLLSESNYGHRYVHLVAPGLNLYSMASEGRYAIASGSSQAVPQVTAAAAMLYAHYKNDLHPSLVKARLIYTADWLPQFDDTESEKRKVWGGMLNFRRAVMYPDDNLLIQKTAEGIVAKFEPVGTSKITVDKQDGLCTIDDPDDDSFPCPNEILFSNVLRITFVQATGRFRVIFLDGPGSKTLRIMKDAKLGGQIKCSDLRNYDPASNQFLPENKCIEKIEVTNMLDYVAATPRTTIKF